MFGVKQLKEINMMKCKHFPEKKQSFCTESVIDDDLDNQS